MDSEEILQVVDAAYQHKEMGAPQTLNQKRFVRNFTV